MEFLTVAIAAVIGILLLWWRAHHRALSSDPLKDIDSAAAKVKARRNERARAAQEEALNRQTQAQHRAERSAELIQVLFEQVFPRIIAIGERLDAHHIEHSISRGEAGFTISIGHDDFASCGVKGDYVEITARKSLPPEPPYRRDAHGSWILRGRSLTPERIYTKYSKVITSLLGEGPGIIPVHERISEML